VEYMRYYNNERKQWTKNKMAPVEYRNHLLAKS
ncbi:MAG: IS3 family transposase, partial [Patescibacteria group bacterium]|nr:IS3 family transposase [Patescibacteria group bacterium]MDE1975573.1 IS3 family transposase [Patescibacteria group bacterium]